MQHGSIDAEFLDDRAGVLSVLLALARAADGVEGLQQPEGDERQLRQGELLPDLDIADDGRTSAEGEMLYLSGG